MRVRIGTRGSQLALWQAGEVAGQFAAAGHEAELVTVKTTGDTRHDVSLAAIGGKGLFIKELEEALERDEIDVAVHSLKDVPSIIPDRFVLAGFLERADPRDVWVQPEGRAIADMPPGSVIGTSAPRRRAQLLALHPHLTIEDIRGNVDTRIQKARDGRYAGIVLAAAGLTRLGRTSEITSYFDLDEMIPAAGQGIVAVECLANNEAMISMSRSITHEPSAQAARLERGVLQMFGTRLDCYSAVAVHATLPNLSPLSPPQPHRGGERARVRGDLAMNMTPHPDPLPTAMKPQRGEGTETFIRAFINGIRAHGSDVDTVYDELIRQGVRL